MYHIAQLYIVFVTYISYALQFYVPMDFIEPPILLKLQLLDTENNERKKVLRYLVQVAVRTFIVLILCEYIFHYTCLGPQTYCIFTYFVAIYYSE